MTREELNNEWDARIYCLFAFALLLMIYGCNAINKMPEAERRPVTWEEPK